jgi:transposase-like protein
MRWPIHPMESVRRFRFSPPHCPWPECPDHTSGHRSFQRNGWYKTLAHPSRIPRFRCKTCQRTCSRQTFSASYYLKRRDLPVAIASGLVACSAHRQIARSCHCAKTTVTRQAERLGRHAILFHARCLAELPGIDEPIVHDHHEVFIGRQDQALGIGTAVGARSWFLYDIDPAPHRGSGRRPDRQPVERAVPQRAYVRSIERTLRALLPKVSGSNPLHLIVDGRVDYPAALRRTAYRVQLAVYPNPKRGPKGSPRSPEAIARDAAMFPVDSLHQFIRHTCSEHKRETISFGRRLESILGRAYLLAVWKNFIKSRSERKPDRTTPAMRIGLTNSRWCWERLFVRRLFPERIRPSRSALTLYRKLATPGLPALDRKHAA